MKERFENFEQKPEAIKKLLEYFPSGMIRELSISEIPTDVLRHFEGKSSLFILPENYRPGNFHTLFLLNGESPEERVYGAIQTKKYDSTKDPDTNTEELTYLVSTQEGEITGYCEIRFNLSKNNEYFKNKPFVGFTRTHEKFKGNKLGAKRLKMMNEVSHALYEQPLSSDTIITDPAKKVWEEFINGGEAEKFKDGKNDRYRFLSSKN